MPRLTERRCRSIEDRINSDDLRNTVKACLLECRGMTLDIIIEAVLALIATEVRRAISPRRRRGR